MPLTTVQVGAGWFSESPGGLDRYYHDLIEALPEAGVNCRGLVVGTTRVDQETDGSVRAVAEPTENVRRRWRAFREAVNRIWPSIPASEPKVLATHYALYGYPLLKDRAGRPTVVHFFGPWAGAGGGAAGWFKRRIERKVYRSADRLITLSDAAAELLTEKYGVDAARITTVPGGVDCDRFAAAAAMSRADARRQFGWPEDRPTILCVRRLSDGMGLDNLVDAIRLVRQRVPAAVCLIAGRGPLAETLVSRIDAAGLGDAITLLGFVPEDDLPLAYRAADVTVHPAERADSGFGLRAAESLSAGTPAVVTPVGGLPEVVRDLDTRLVAADATATGLAAALTRALEDRALLPSPEVCRLYAAGRFDWSVVAARVAAVYADAAGVALPIPAAAITSAPAE